MDARLEKSKIRQKEILEKTYPLIQARGYHATGVKDLAEEAAMPKSSFFNYFKSKEEFIAQALLIYGEKALGVSEKFLLSDKKAETRIHDLFKDRIKIAKEQIKSGQRCLINTAVMELGSDNPEIRNIITEIMDKLKATLASCLTEVHKKKKLILSPPVLAELLENSWRGTLIYAVGQGSEKPLDAFGEFIREIIPGSTK